MEVVENKIKCPSCGKERDKSFRRFKGIFYCNRHYRQLKKYGQIIETIYDKNTFLEEDKIVKILLKNNELFTIIDKEDFPLVKDYKWKFSSGYAATKNNGKTIYMQDLILPSNKTIDHINRDTLDNRKCNLRESTKSQNMMNSKVSKRNTSGVKGVSWIKERKRWVASLKFEGKNYHIGYFIKIEEAIQARIDYEAKLVKEFSNLYNENTKRIEVVYNGKMFHSYIPENIER